MPKFPPPPPGGLTLPAITTTIPAGAGLWRIYFAGGVYPTAWNAFRNFGHSTSRFDHHDPPPRRQTKSILYAARSASTCVAEVFQVARTIDRARNAPWLVEFELTRDVVLLDLTGVWPTQAGASMALSTGPRPRAQQWSRAVHQAYPRVEGVLYPSSMHANARAVAIYERARNALPAAPMFHRALADPALASRLKAAATRLGYRIV